MSDMVNPRERDPEVVELLKKIGETAADWKELSRSEIRGLLRDFSKECDRVFTSLCSARRGSAICGRPQNHTGPHCQESIMWDGDAEYLTLGNWHRT